jgi:hypothetical protein
MGEKGSKLGDEKGQEKKKGNEDNQKGKIIDTQTRYGNQVRSRLAFASCLIVPVLGVPSVKERECGH